MTNPARATMKFVRTLACLLIAAAGALAQAQTAEATDRQMADLGQQLVARMQQTQGWRIAVLPFTMGEGLSPAMADYMVRSLTTQLIKQTQLEVVERQLIAAAMGEMKLQRSGAFDRATVAELGRLLGANAVVTGSATAFQDGVSVHAVVLEVQVGRNVAAGSVMLRREAHSRDALTSGNALIEPALAGPQLQRFATHEVHVLRLQRLGADRVGLALRYVPTTALAYTVLQSADSCTARLLTRDGTALRCVRSSMPPLRSLPNGVPLNGVPVVVTYEFEGVLPADGRFELNASNALAPVLLSNPVRQVQHLTLRFVDLAAH